MAKLNLQDASLTVTGQLPAGATRTSSQCIDLRIQAGLSTNDDFNPQRAEFELDIPQATLAQAPASSGLTFDIFTSLNTAGTSIVPYMTWPGTPVSAQSGIPNSLSFRFQLNMTSLNRFLGFGATGTTTSALSSLTATLKMVF